MLLGTASLLAGLLYLNALHNPFIYDDYHTVVENRSLHQVTNLRAIVLHALTRPIVNFSYAVDYAVWGSAPFGFHLTNVLLHMLNVALLFHFVWRSTRQSFEAFVAALLFAIHPMMTEAVGYISGRSELLCATFFLFGLLTGRRWIRENGGGWLVVTGCLWVAMLLTKEIGAMFPFVLVAYDFLLAGRGSEGWRRRLTTVYLPWMAFAVVAGVIRLVILARVEYPGQVWVRWPYVLVAIDVIRRYIGLMFFPTGQTIFHAVAPITSLMAVRSIVAIVVLAALAGTAWWYRRTEALVTLGIVWFTLLLLPSAVLTVLDQGEPMAEHRVYAASCGFFLAIAAVTGTLRERFAGRGALPERAAAFSLAVVVLALAVQTYIRNRVWSEPLALWRESVSLAPQHYRPRLLLGEALQDAGRRAEAVEQFETAIRLEPADPTGHIKLGEALVQLGDVPAARKHLADALALDPNNESARQYLRIIDDLQLRVERP